MISISLRNFLNTVGVGDLLMPDKPEAEFEKNLAKLATSPLPVLACNGFIRPANLHCVGADANHDLILEWSETTFRRMKKAGGKIIVFGSSGARKIPNGWSREKADEQFVALLKRMGPLAEAHGITVSPSSNSGPRNAITSTASARAPRSSAPPAIPISDCSPISITWLAWATRPPT
jgi:sugar phosphate isomerase/epimerase